jgi:hypothetical protein
MCSLSSKAKQGLITATLFSVFLTGGAAAPTNPYLVMPPPPQDVFSACAPNAEEPRLDLHVEVRDAFGLWRAGESVQVSSSIGFPLAAIHCEGPWVNFRLQPGKYRVMAFLGPLRSAEMEIEVAPSGTVVTLMLEPAPNSRVAEILGYPRTDVAELTSLPPPELPPPE